MSRRPRRRRRRAASDGPGPVALVGGHEFREPARDLDAWLLERSGEKAVTVLPTAAARSRPEMAVQTAREYFATLGASVQEVMVLDRTDADYPSFAEDVRDATFVYLTGGDPRLVVDALGGSAVWTAILETLADGAVLAGSSAGAMALCDRMLVPRRNELTDGLGLLRSTLVVPHYNQWKTLPDAPAGTDVIALDECTGLVIDGERGHVLGTGSASLWRDGLQVWSHTAPAQIDKLR